MTTEEYQDLLKEICMGDQDAFDFLLQIAQAVRVWDDVWDQDRVVDRDSIDEVLVNLSFGLSQNPFFVKHRQALEGQMFVSWSAWQAANEWENSQDRMKQIYAFFVRDYCFEMDHLVAWYVGGIEHAKKMNLKIRDAALSQLRKQQFKF